MKLPLLISRLILGGVFVYASFDKILHPHEFAEVVYNYQILPDALVNFTAILLPWLELSAGVFLILGLFLRGALFTCNVLLAVFLVAIAFNLARGLDIDCGDMILYLLRDAFFLAMGLSVFFYVLRRENPGAFPEGGAEKTSV
jgi:uncharacterized membrane protein YphA (DoxX/SURF4 family)